MFHVDNNSAVPVMPAVKPVVSAVTSFFTEGGNGVPPTYPGPDWFNIIQSELLAVLAAAGITPDKANNVQLLAAMRALFLDTSQNGADIQDKALFLQNLQLTDTDDPKGSGISDSRVAVVQPFSDAVIRTQHDKNAEQLSVKDFGAKGDGVTDDTVALQKAFKSGMILDVPDGIYLHSMAIGIASGTRINASEGAVLKMMDGVDQVHHSIVSANATSLDARLATLENVDAIIGGYQENISITGLTVDANAQNRPKTYTDREQGTGIELHAVRNVALSSVKVINGAQHCINVRAGTGSYNKGYDYVEKYPSQHVRIIDCVTDNQIYDDGITTHDSEYIWIERCETYLTRNSQDVSKEAVSNGIEIDDGSRYVWVTDCYSNGGFGGYQAKGHANTPPAHHVWFRGCVAENVHRAWVISAVESPTTDLNSTYATCHHIYLDNCTIKNCYVFSNVTAWNAEAHYIQFLNVRHVYITGLQVIGKTHDMPNMGVTQRAIFRFREYNAFIHFERCTLNNVDERSIADQPLFQVELNISDLTIDDMVIDKFVKGPVMFTNATGANFRIDNVTLQQGAAAYPVFRINGVGGGTMRFGRVKGIDSLIPIQTNTISADVINTQDYVAFGDGTTSTFHEISTATDAAGMASLVSGAVGIGNQHVAKVGAAKYPVGSIFSQVQSGDITDTTASGRMRVAVRASGTATPTGVLNISRASLQPATDNVMSGGTAGLKFTQFFATNSTIGTSDATRKRGLREPSLAELMAFATISRLPSVWQWISRYDDEGDDARLHSGPTVQACIEIMGEHGLEWSQYACFCYDEWEAAPAVIRRLPAQYDDSGTLISDEQEVIEEPAREAGCVYSLRKEELLWWCLRAQVFQQDAFEERLSKLESR
ncbi:glycosyl hydrolase family 28-related protein [Citrobacter sp. Cf140]|uniref:glycosyl hydrolase family 28-related protein n=1 Tax=Citrobacter sp. Cf140 TaxID=2985083 RepID=UPI00336A1A20